MTPPGIFVPTPSHQLAIVPSTKAADLVEGPSGNQLLKTWVKQLLQVMKFLLVD
jgi:hypothetical protein